MNATLMPCPFCGGEAKYVDPYWYSGTRAGNYVRCTKCSAQNERPRLVSDDRPIDAWNKRAPDPAAARWQAIAEGLADDMQRIVHHDPTLPGLHFDNFDQLLASAVGTARAALATYTAAKDTPNGRD